MKKGFTIVELAIVLVIIGIILAMAVKGKTLVDAARVKADLAKINKIEAAVHMYYAKTGSVPVYGPMDGNDRSLVEMELILDTDFLLEILHMPHPSSAGALKRMYLVSCQDVPYPDGSGEKGWGWNYLVGGTGRVEEWMHVCILTGEDDLTNSTPAVINAGSTHFFVCHVETTLDDSYDRTGTGRQSVDIDAGSTQTRLMDFGDCHRLRRDGGREIYMYKII